MQWSIKRFTAHSFFDNCTLNPLSANPSKWLNTFKQFIGKLPTNCLNVFDHFVGWALKGLNFRQKVNPIHFLWTGTCNMRKDHQNSPLFPHKTSTNTNCITIPGWRKWLIRNKYLEFAREICKACNLVVYCLKRTVKYCKYVTYFLPKNNEYKVFLFCSQFPIGMTKQFYFDFSL